MDATGTTDRPRLAVGITYFRPAPGQVAGLLGRLDGPVIGFDNGGLSPDDRAALARHGEILIGDGRNQGIAAALNALADAAARGGADRLLLLDQDAAPSPGMAAILADGMDRLTAAGRAVAVVGPRPTPVPDRKAPAYPAWPGVGPHGTLRPVAFLATSGSLVDLAALARTGPFRADYFIDAVDLEWCFRAWSAGLGCYVEEAAEIGHGVGTGVIRAPRLGIEMPRQPPFRMAAYLRNTVYGWRLPHVPLRWKLRQAAYLPVQAGLYWRDAGWRPGILRQLARGVLDGFLGRLGPPRDLPGASPRDPP